MATSTEMEMLAGKALFDPEFRRRLIEYPVEAAASVGVKLDEAQVGYVKNIDPYEVEKLADEVTRVMPPPRMRMAWGG